MRDHRKCNCPICKVERHLTAALGEPPGADQFAIFASSREPLANFESVSMLVQHLHSQREGEERPPSANEIFTTLIRASKPPYEAELSQSVLTLAFIPAIHRTYSEVKAWFRELPADDISQQTFTYFLELSSSAPVGLVDGQLSFLIARSLRRNVFRWAQKEMILLREREKTLEELRHATEPSFNDNFETVSLLNDFLDYAHHNGIISEFERALLLKMKVEGFQAKEAANMNAVLTAKAVQHRIERIMSRLQKAAALAAFGESTEVLPNLRLRKKRKKNPLKKLGDFSLGSRSEVLAIDTSRRQLSLDSSPKQSESKPGQFAASERNLSPTIATLPSAFWRACVSAGSSPQRRAVIRASVAPPTEARQFKSGESLPSDFDARRTRILRKELASNEIILPKKVRDSLVSTRRRHAFLFSGSSFSRVRSGARKLTLGERRQRFDDRVYDDHRSWSFPRFHCCRGPHVRLW